MHKLQELLGGACGEMAIAMRYLFQAWNCRMPGKCKDLIIDIATEEMGHVEMTATMVARLPEGAPATATTKAAAADPVVGRGCLPYSTRLMRASWAGNCALPPFPASLLCDSYLHSCLPRVRSDRLTGFAVRSWHDPNIDHEGYSADSVEVQSGYR